MCKYSVLEKIRDSLLCVTNRYIKVTSKLTLPLVSRSKIFSSLQESSKTNLYQLNLVTK